MENKSGFIEILDEAPPQKAQSFISMAHRDLIAALDKAYAENRVVLLKGTIRSSVCIETVRRLMKKSHPNFTVHSHRRDGPNPDDRWKVLWLTEKPKEKCGVAANADSTEKS